MVFLFKRWKPFCVMSMLKIPATRMECFFLTKKKTNTKNYRVKTKRVRERSEEILFFESENILMYTYTQHTKSLYQYKYIL